MKEFYSYIFISILFLISNSSCIQAKWLSTSLNFFLINHPINNDLICTNGTCSIVINDIDNKTNELMKLGWGEVESRQALIENDEDIEKAALYLENTETIAESVNLLKQNLTDFGWLEEFAEAALYSSSGNLTEAIRLLENEENALVEQFEDSVSEMMNDGWDELVARKVIAYFIFEAI